MISWFRIRTADIRIALHILLSQFPPYSGRTTINKIHNGLYCSFNYVIYSVATSRACLVSSRQQTLGPTCIASYQLYQFSRQARHGRNAHICLSRLASRSRVLKSVSRLTTTQSTKLTKSVDGTPSSGVAKGGSSGAAAPPRLAENLSCTAYCYHRRRLFILGTGAQLHGKVVQANAEQANYDPARSQQYFGEFGLFGLIVI